MPRRPKPPLAAKDLQDFKYFDLLLPLLATLHDAGTARARACNRQLSFDQ